jgi:hypothetical protein
MGYSTHTTWERLYKAVDSLAAGTDSIQERLKSAFLDISPLQVKEFPEELQDAVQTLQVQINKVESLSAEETSKLAAEIVRIYDIVARKHCTPDE